QVVARDEHEQPQTRRDERRDQDDEREPHRDSSIRRSNVSAPCLSSGSLRLPHLGLCTQEGQPRSHGHCASSRAVSSTQPSKTSKPRSAIPTPPEWPS